MKKYKTLILIWVAAMLFIYLAAYAYWERANHQYWSCRAIGPTGDCGFRPDGPMGALLFILIPLGATTLLFLVVLFLAKAKPAKKGRSYEGL